MLTRAEWPLSPYDQQLIHRANIQSQRLNIFLFHPFYHLRYSQNLHSLNHVSVGFPITFMQQTILWVEYLNIYQLSICFSNVVVALLDGKLGGLSSRGRLSAEPLLDCSTLDRQGGLRLVRLLLLLLTWPTACWPSMARPQPFQYSQYTLTKAHSM